MKAGKEEIVGLMTAVRRYLDLNHEEVMRGYEERVQMVITAFADDRRVEASRDFPSEAGQPMPRALLLIDEEAVGMGRDDLLKRLVDEEPGIALAPSGANGVFINPQTLEPGQTEIIIRRIKEIISDRA